MLEPISLLSGPGQEKDAGDSAFDASRTGTNLCRPLQTNRPIEASPSLRSILLASQTNRL
jgi:hypothetical protein